MRLRLVLLVGAFLVNVGATPITTNPLTGLASASQVDLSGIQQILGKGQYAQVLERIQSQLNSTNSSDTSAAAAPSDSDQDQPSAVNDPAPSPSPSVPVNQHYTIGNLTSSIHSLSTDYADGTHHTINDLASQMGGL
jgi:hypothetical protein